MWDPGLSPGVSVLLATEVASELCGPGLKPTETSDSSPQPSLTSSPGRFQVGVPSTASRLPQFDWASAFETGEATSGRTQDTEGTEGPSPGSHEQAPPAQTTQSPRGVPGATLKARGSLLGPLRCPFGPPPPVQLWSAASVSRAGGAGDVLWPKAWMNSSSAFSAPARRALHNLATAFDFRRQPNQMPFSR